jgi:hypothetical protein
LVPPRVIRTAKAHGEKGKGLANYNPEKGLQIINVGEAADKHWARANVDPDAARYMTRISNRLERLRHEMNLWTRRRCYNLPSKQKPPQWLSTPSFARCEDCAGRRRSRKHSQVYLAWLVGLAGILTLGIITRRRDVMPTR